MTFQWLMNSILHVYIEEFMVTYPDDLLFFSNSQDNHIRHLEIVLNCSDENELYAGEIARSS